MGRLIPAGTGFEYYRHVRIPADEPPPPPAPPQPSDDELELERDMEYFVEPEEALGAANRRSRAVASGFSRTSMTQGGERKPVALFHVRAPIGSVTVQAFRPAGAPGSRARARSR